MPAQTLPSLRVVALVAAIVLTGCHRPTTDDGIPPDRALETFELHPDFTIELVAAEPLVADPIDMEIDEYGRLYVLEMHGYPDDQSGSDRIRLLRDVDGDGRMDESSIFADSLVWPMGIMRWKNGLIVTEAPDVVYLEDTDGDGRADVRETILTGFFDQDPESDVNNPIYGLDNTIYLANGRRSEHPITFAGRPDGPRIAPEATNRNVRFHPDHLTLEAQSSRTQFGFDFDRWGRRLLVSNRNHIFQEVVASRYLDRRPDLLVSNASASISDHGSAAQVYPITSDPNPQILTDIGEITAACGITFYDGGAFPPEFANVSFVGEPAHNLVHVDRLTADGPALTASRLRPHSEFLASTDAWFRPVNMYVGPDGALYVVDYYRQIIEGPTWLSEEVLQSGDLYNGSDRGRIYRIAPKGAAPADWTRGLSLGDASGEELLSHLVHPNIWWRRHAQRLLVDRADESVAPALEAMALEGGEPVGRLHALWTLEGLGRLTPELIERALGDAEAGVRENAVQLAEGHLEEAPSLKEPLLALTSDPDPRVRFQLLLTLGFVDSPAASAAREELLFADVDDPWMQVAALSAPSADAHALLRSVTARYEPSYASFVRRLSAMVAASSPPATVRQLLQHATNPDATEAWPSSVLAGLAEGLRSRQETDIEDEAPAVVAAFFDHPSDSVRSAALDILRVTGLPAENEPVVERALTIAEDPDASPDRRAEALELVRLAEPGRYVDRLRALIQPDVPSAVQAAAVRAWGDAPGLEVSRYLLDRWPTLTADIRDAAMETFLLWPLRLDRVDLILAAIEDGTVHPSGISWPHKVTLMRDIPDSLKLIAQDLITSAEAQREEDIVDYVETVRRRTADPQNGRPLFERQCAMCHRLGDIAEGSDYGPDLMSVRGWKPENVVSHVVAPNQSITQGYEFWQITLKSGETVQGIIAAETANAVTVSLPQAPPRTIPRTDIESLSDLGVSSMPSDFMSRMSPQEMADLTAFIRTGR